LSCADHDDEPIIAPGLAAMLRRHPQRVRKAAAGTIMSGMLLFVVASIALPAGADPSHKKAAAAPAVAAPADLDAVLPANVAPAAAAANIVLAGKPRHVAKRAPVTRAVISGLAANGIPKVALNAYRVAAARLANAEPGCGIDWALLAGIGREESDHGRFAGATLNADGTSTPRIIGIPLNGRGTERIGDTDHGQLDGDTVYDRAVGPMQFIPSTWAAYGSDANGDGKADVFNVNDAALTAARYLCAAGGNLRTHAGQVAAVLAYNHSDQYLAQVLALANAYRTGVAVYGIPVGNVTGGLPPVSNTGYLPPVNPGPPTAVGTTAAKKKTAAAKPAATTTPSPDPAKSTSPTSASPSTAPSGTSGGTSGGGATSSTTPLLPAPTSSASPTPTRTKTCILWDMIDPNKCDLWV
jgi:hypothetical protein